MDILLPLAYFGPRDLGLSGIFALAGTIFWIVMLVDAVRREFRDSTMKLVWILILVFTNLLGAIIYYFVGRPTGYLRS
ncbi:MAG: PLD nuclease N-terminal domain-containing protein [Armatimonadota bacterium]